MIYFVTNDEKHLKKYENHPLILCIEDSDTTFMMFMNWLSTVDIAGYDTEGNGLDAWVNNSLVHTIGDEDIQFVLHTPYCAINKYFNAIKDKKCRLLGHNIKHDLKVLYADTKILYYKVYDTMIADLRCFQKLGLSASLENLAVRYLDVYPTEMDKTIRTQFIGCNVKTFTLEEHHILYAVGDVKHLFPIKEKQEQYIKRYQLHNLLYNIEFPLVHIIAKAELTGFGLDIVKWKEIYIDNVEKMFEVECKLDEEVRRLRDLKFNSNPKLKKFMTGGKWDNQRIKNPQYDIFNADGTTNNLDLFGKPMSANTYLGRKAKTPFKIQKNPNNINFGSDTQIVEIFGRLQEPVLTQSEILVIPRFNKRGKIDRTVHSFTTKEDVLDTYKIMLPESIMLPFIDLLIKHRGYKKATSTYGMNFINHLNAVTGKLHTVFGQCFTDTGRMNSGGGKKEPDKPNFQNIPAKADYAIPMRNCFIADEGYSIGTHDLSGAELIIMCSLSQDMKLLRIAREDMHSYVAQGCWRAIYAHRARNLSREISQLNRFDKEKEAKLQELINLSINFIVDASKKSLRTAFKPMTFGTIYGMYAAKAGKTLNIPKDEGQVVIDWIKGQFPAVFAMVEAASAFALQNGYVIVNNRTKSRMWFPSIIKMLKGEITMDDHFIDISKEQSEARNGKIQGTQADMLKEATVALQTWIVANHLEDEITILSWVHDEIIDQHPKYLDGKSDEWKTYLKEFKEKALDNNHFDIGDNILIYNDKWYPSFPEVKAQIMRDTCNKYLHNVTMDVDYHVEPYWTK